MGAILDLVRVLFEPTAVFERVREKPRFLAPFLALAVITILIGTLQLPFIRAGMTAQFAQTPNMTPEQQQMAMRFAPIGLVVGPIFYGLFLVLCAVLLWAAVAGIGRVASFSS